MSIINSHLPCTGSLSISKMIFSTAACHPAKGAVPPQLSSGPGNAYGQSTFSSDFPTRKKLSSQPKSFAKKFSYPEGASANSAMLLSAFPICQITFCTDAFWATPGFIAKTKTIIKQTGGENKETYFLIIF